MNEIMQAANFLAAPGGAAIRLLIMLRRGDYKGSGNLILIILINLISFIRFISRISLIRFLFLHHAGEGAAVFALFDRLAFVVFLLAASHAYDEFGEATVVDKQTQGHDGVAGLFDSLT